MKHYRKLALPIFVIMMLIMIGCSGTRRIKQIDSFLAIKPAAPLPEFVAKKQPPNLIIEIDNVADERRSYKNYVELFINNKFLILPKGEITNVKDRYSYHLALQPGIYNIKAIYYASTGWQEKGFKIIPRDEKVMVFPDKRAILKVSIEKDAWGAPLDKTSYFEVTYEPADGLENR